MALEVTAAGEWVDDIQVGMIGNEWYVPIAHCLANPSPRPRLSTASTKECKLWMSAQQFNLEDNGLLWLPGDLEKTQANKIARAKKHFKEGVEITVGVKEKEEDRKANMRGQLCIPKTMQRRILYEAQNTPAGGHLGADRTYLHMKDQNF